MKNEQINVENFEEEKDLNQEKENSKHYFCFKLFILMCSHIQTEQLQCSQLQRYLHSHSLDLNLGEEIKYLHVICNVFCLGFSKHL
jgi:hypothetical protein